MIPSDVEILNIVSHPVARDYSYIMYAICLLRKNRSCFWARCSSTHSVGKLTARRESSFRADAIIASRKSKSRKLCCPIIDRELTRSSIDLAISTALIQSIVIWRSAVRRKPQFWSWLSSFEIPSCQKMHFRNRNSLTIHHTILKMGSTSMIQHSTSTLEVRWSIDVFNDSLLNSLSFPCTISFSCCFGSIESQF